MPKGYKRNLKTHFGMVKGPARRRVGYDKTRVWVPHWSVEVRQRCDETRIPSRAHRQYQHSTADPAQIIKWK